MQNRSAKRRLCRLLLATLVALSAGSLCAADDRLNPPHRVFATSRYSIDDVLSRPYDPDVPMGSVGDRLWASSPQGWAFRDDVHWLYLTNLKAFDIEIRDERGLLHPAKATYYPSHVHLEGAMRATVASASFTFTIDNAQNPLTQPFRPEKRWTCWSSGKREDWYAVDFGTPRKLAGLKVYFFDDAPSGGCRPPERYQVQQWIRGQWQSITPTKLVPERPAKGENTVEFEPIETDRLRLLFRNAGENFYTGLYGIEPADPAEDEDVRETDQKTRQRDEEDATEAVPSTLCSVLSTNDSALSDSRATPLNISADKFISADDVLVSAFEMRNTGNAPEELTVQLLSPSLFGEEKNSELKPDSAFGLRWWRATSTARLHDIEVVSEFGYSGTQKSQFVGRDGPLLKFLLQPGETGSLKVALAINSDGNIAKRALDRWMWGQMGTPCFEQAREYQAWFDANLAYFDCSDPWIRKMYYHRAYNLRKNMLDPKLGRMQWKTQSEGRWRSGWYPNVISYGGAHQVREARWLRDPSFAQGHLRTFAENEKADGVFPSHVKPSGPQGGQYTDWITSSAWDTHLVHPDRNFLAAVADKLAANVRGWQKVYDPDGDGLLLVDSHWWTGMEYQPSFFFFSGYKPRQDFHEPENKVSLDRVDLTAYNFGNAAAVARIYREIGQPEKAREFDQLAERIAAAVRAKMWDAGQKFFYSLKHDDGAKADVKEVIGVYPFYFGMIPHGDKAGYEAAWRSIIDPDQFWTPWPVASASRQCAAYSQDNWPGDGRRAACMWNGPTWPHANSIVLTAMARSLREAREPVAGRAAGGDSPTVPAKPGSAHAALRTQHVWDLFYSFTKAQYRDQDLRYPWTGEYYNGETAKWKTAERDYNHSTWLDVLIPDLIGLVPRSDDMLEIDPLVPPGSLSHFLLDGQHYRGHDVAIVWDDPQRAESNDAYGDGRRGLDIYVDGKLVCSSSRLQRLCVELPVK